MGTIEVCDLADKAIRTVTVFQSYYYTIRRIAAYINNVYYTDKICYILRI